MATTILRGQNSTREARPLMLQGKWVLGLNHGAHDAACALVRDGELIVAVEQERLSRNKRAVREFPSQAVEQCLAFAGIDLGEVSEIVMGSDHQELTEWLGLDPEQRREVLPYADSESIASVLRSSTLLTTTVPPIRSVKHHLAHAASAFWPSGFESAAILVMDAMGESTSGLLGYGQGDDIETLYTLPIEHSLGFFYEAACAYVGFKEDDAGKLMGLAAYGRPRFDIPLRAEDGLPCWEGIPLPASRGRAFINDRMAALVAYFAENCFPYAAGLCSEIMAYADFAASVQRALESTVLGLLRVLQQRTGRRQLVLAGGVALNCTCNGVIARSGVFDEIYIQPAAHDAGVAVGAALLGARGQGLHPGADSTPYLTPAEGEHQIEGVIRAQGWDFKRYADDDLVRIVASAIAGGAVVAWHQGRSELGPRALGARSLLGDPRARRTLLRLNNLKGREIWRPLAPSVLLERFHEYFDGTPNPYMIMAAAVKPDKQSAIPAVVHVDGSARPQVVLDGSPPRYASLLRAFDAVAGVPILVNTSLNLRGEPLCYTAADTLSLFSRCDADLAVIGPYLIRK